ncbi:MAG: helix-turn-helix transcriptional regulator [Azonexus sp.]|nr:helix-turn-helix domain-containing protein [Azonexus sp.]MCK6413762.1 helix-turn-helix transcriptional regulator [Azonexus sp.]
MTTDHLAPELNTAIAGECPGACPVRRTAELIEGKWTTLIIRDLIGGKKRYSELQRSLSGISPRLLADRLRLLEQRGLLTRTQYPTVPPTTEYALTALGLELLDVITAMAKFGLRLAEQEAAAGGSGEAQALPPV